MDPAFFGVDALQLALTLVLPALLASLAIGLVLSFFDFAAQGQDAGLSFVPRLLAVAAVLLLAREVLSSELVQFTSRVFAQIALVSQ